MRAEFERFVRSRLEAHSDALRGQLRALVAHSFRAEVASLEFDVFADGFTSGFPVRTYFLDAERTEFFLVGADGPQYPSPIDPGLLAIPPLYSRAEEEQFAAADSSLDVYTIAAETLTSWFVEIWAQAAGSTLPIGASIGIHDDDTRVDLLSGARRPT